jgi:hypothetical protein
MIYTGGSITFDLPDPATSVSYTPTGLAIDPRTGGFYVLGEEFWSDGPSTVQPTIMYTTKTGKVISFRRIGPGSTSTGYDLSRSRLNYIYEFMNITPLVGSPSRLHRIRNLAVGSLNQVHKQRNNINGADVPGSAWDHQQSRQIYNRRTNNSIRHQEYHAGIQTIVGAMPVGGDGIARGMDEIGTHLVHVVN